MTNGAVSRFPDAAYFIIASRLRPGLDGGYTVATMRRALDFELGGVTPTILTVEFAPDVAELREQFIALGLATGRTVMRNLYADLRANPSLLRSHFVAVPSTSSGTGNASVRSTNSVPELVEGPSADDVAEKIDLDAAGTPWRITVSNGGGQTLYTDYLDASGKRLLRLPFVTGRADWHRAEIAIDVFGESGEVLGQLDGFGALYRFWVESVVAASGNDLNVVVCEAKQVGELLSVGPRDYTLVHTVHNAHTLPPHAWDSPMDELWSGWFDRVDDMDAVLWLTETQRADVVRRFGEHDGWVVVPHPAEPVSVSAASAVRDLSRVVMLSRLVEQKRVEDAIEAWPELLKRVPDARLDVFGDGPLRSKLATRIDELGLSDRVVLHGHVSDAVNELTTAGALLLTSRHEGQPLVVLEALSRGCPVVAYDVHYGPADMIEDGRSGVLVESGDRDALVDAIETAIGDRARNSAMSAAALDWARGHGADVSMGLMSELIAGLLAAETTKAGVS